jgi:hypothetical protein
MTLSEGLEEIGETAFAHCTLLREIHIPSPVKTIHDSAFEGCANLTRVKFCDGIEDFVSCAAVQDWWNQGLHVKSLSTYSFLVKCSIPERLGSVLIVSWQANIYNMLNRIPTITAYGLNAHFDAINTNLSMYETQMLLEQLIPNEDIFQSVLPYF